jgi:para-aminobenzoate synthetase component 1
MRESQTYHISNIARFTDNLIRFVAGLETGIVLPSNMHLTTSKTTLGQFDLLAGLGALESLTCSQGCFNNLREMAGRVNDWLFGYLTYDLKNEVEALTSGNFDGLGFPELYFFQPRFVLTVKKGLLKAHFHPEFTTKEEVDGLIEAIAHRQAPEYQFGGCSFSARTPRKEYLETVAKVQGHIQRGDVYEMNLCQEYFCESIQIEPAEVFIRLNRVSPTPFASFLKVGQRYLLSASPERYLRKTGNHITSQPIKGTTARGQNASEDLQAKDLLARDPKERAENVMIVDLVRNDLSRVAARGSVRVDELCGIYTFGQVHQMISTISCRLRPELGFVDAIKATFPMGSMTGAPKIRAMELIEQYERAKRGLYSGSVGYITPNHDFDFNVVIRSLLYNRENGYLSFSVGGAITIQSEAEREYNECLLKAKAILTTLNATIEDAEPIC